jgi:hypothetical protein
MDRKSSAPVHAEENQEIRYAKHSVIIPQPDGGKVFIDLTRTGFDPELPFQAIAYDRQMLPLGDQPVFRQQGWLYFSDLPEIDGRAVNLYEVSQDVLGASSSPPQSSQPVLIGIGLAGAALLLFGSISMSKRR